MKSQKILSKLIIIALLTVSLGSCSQNNEIMIEVTYDPALGMEGFDGRLLIMITKDTIIEPRFQINDTDQSGIIIGKDVQQWIPNTSIPFSKQTLAYPIETLADLEAGDYFVQALLHKYETFQLVNGHTVQLPMDQGEGQHWNISPKNIYSKPIKVTIGKKNSPIQIVLTTEIPSIAVVQDSEYIKHIKIKLIINPIIPCSASGPRYSLCAFPPSPKLVLIIVKSFEL